MGKGIFTRNFRIKVYISAGKLTNRIPNFTIILWTERQTLVLATKDVEEMHNCKKNLERKPVYVRTNLVPIKYYFISLL